MNKFKIQFNCNVDYFFEMESIDKWHSVHKILIIYKSSRMKRKEGWIERVGDKIPCEHCEYYENDTYVIIDIYDFEERWLSMSKKECYEKIVREHDKYKKVLRGLKINNYEFIYDFAPQWNELDNSSNGDKNELSESEEDAYFK